MKTRKPWNTDKPAQFYYWKVKIHLKLSWSAIRQFGLDLTSSRVLRGKEVFLAQGIQSSNSFCLWNKKGRKRRLDFSPSRRPGFLLKHSYFPVSNQSLFINWLGPASQHTAPSNKGNGCVGCLRVSEVDPVTKALLIDASSRAWVGAQGAPLGAVMVSPFPHQLQSLAQGCICYGPQGQELCFMTLKRVHFYSGLWNKYWI